jgi:hypothetical protein
MLSPLEKEKLTDEFYKFCPGARENGYIADWWLTRIEKAVEAERERIRNEAIINTFEGGMLPVEFQGREYALIDLKALTPHSNPIKRD